MHDIRNPHETQAGDDFTRNYPATRTEAIEAGRFWPEGLTHNSEPPRTLRELLTDRRGHDGR